MPNNLPRRAGSASSREPSTVFPHGRIGRCVLYIGINLARSRRGMANAGDTGARIPYGTRAHQRRWFDNSLCIYPNCSCILSPFIGRSSYLLETLLHHIRISRSLYNQVSRFGRRNFQLYDRRQLWRPYRSCPRIPCTVIPAPNRCVPLDEGNVGADPHPWGWGVGVRSRGDSPGNRSDRRGSLSANHPFGQPWTPKGCDRSFRTLSRLA